MPLLDWLSKDEAVRSAQKVPYRLLQPVPKLSYGDAASPNMVIQGDNLDALKALLPHYAGQVKCIYIDPPYNTKSAFEHYDDNLEHSKWLSLMYPRLELLRELLSEHGSIWVSIDDHEMPYLRTIMDEIFGRGSFIANVIWQKIFSPKNSAKHFSVDHDYVVVYARNPEKWKPNPLPRTEKQDKMYKNPDNDPRGAWTSGDLSARNFYGQGTYPVTCPSGRVIPGPPPGMYWRVSKTNMERLDSEGRVWWGKNGDGVPRLKRYLSEVKQGRVPQTFWPYEEVGHTQEAKKEVVALLRDNVFGTPKPERLIQRVLKIATDPNDIVLDSFLGSGTTAAVAHKMGRQYIGIEMGEHAVTHCQPRLKAVTDGEEGGISKSVGWTSGGGFTFYRLGEAVFSESGSIRPDIDFASLANFIWYLETKSPLTSKPDSPLLGTCSGIAYYLLYNGILGDKRPKGGNVLTSGILAGLPKHDGPKVIYGETTRFGPARLEAENIVFKQIPYDVRMR